MNTAIIRGEVRRQAKKTGKEKYKSVQWKWSAGAF